MKKILFALLIFPVFASGKTYIKKLAPPKQSVTINNKEDELDFEVINKSGKTIYITCFSYVQKRPLQRWHWDKSPIYKLVNNARTMINIDTIFDDATRDHVFGYIAVFNNAKEAEDAIYELTNDDKKIDLDLLYKLKGKIVEVVIEKYGFKKATIDFSVVERFKKKIHPELDFVVQNRTGKTIFVTCFVYQNKDNARSVWEYDKTVVQKLANGEMALIDIDSVNDPRNREYMIGYLAVFDEAEEKKARDAIYELLDPKQKLDLGRLQSIKNKKIILEIERYGTLGDLIDYSIKPITKIMPKMRHIPKKTSKSTITIKPRTHKKEKAVTITPLKSENLKPKIVVVPKEKTTKKPFLTKKKKTIKKPIKVKKQSQRNRKYKLFA